MAEGFEKARLFALSAHKSFPQAQIWLYGSYAAGHATDASDIDVAVVFPQGTSARLRYLPLQVCVNDIANEIDSMIEPAVFEFGDPLSFVEREIVPKGVRLA